ncbi:putative phospholipid-transporting ATPase [Tritrichomonas foetus]|uniref:Phospholipid-transporting ATPase n=1 Tax=Tritrichomonas foetus TaxID=1144522 RepID=A0A1J4JSG9_9EUKA|nr:putative phospholipid-transporting ATPase [Tritrichomonas foetus]|eukprot:OHT01368.1 putative phospholipid-transporting ATPase [Tritrichomonas foetus]
MYRTLTDDNSPLSPRLVEFPDCSKTFSPNIIKTSHYTWYNFIFLNLFEQFHRFANLFFLFLAIIQAIPSISPLNQFAGFVQLTFMLSITAIKNAYEDFLRHKTDEEVNDRLVYVYNSQSNFDSNFPNFENNQNSSFLQKKWCDLKVSDVIRIEPQCEVPADCILIKSPDGRCRIETSALDGETNLKFKYSINQKVNKNSKFLLEISPPNANLSTFSGKIFYQDENLPISIENFIPRGCIMKENMPILAIVVYTGEDTKLIMNSMKPQFKYTEIDKTMSKMAFVLLLVMFLICFLMTVLGKFWSENFKDGYIELDSKKWYLQWFSWIIDLQMIIPLAVYSSLDVVRFLLSFGVSSDEEMIFEGKKSKCRNSDLVSTIGRVTHIFSDKTGTLTKNLMSFRAISFPEVVLGVEYKSDHKQEQIKSIVDYVKLHIESNNDIKNFLLTTVLCNSAEIVNGKYVSNSPDELAFLEFSKQCGYELLKKQMDKITIKINDKICEIECPIRFEFSSQRKRSSIICLIDGKWNLLSKGADTVIIPRSKNNSQVFQERLNQFGSCGLRTLCFANKELNSNEINSLLTIYNNIRSMPVDVEGYLNKLADDVEKDLTIYCISGIEDELQNYVVESLQLLKRANIKTWVLTGDRLDTAIDVARNSGIIQKKNPIIYQNDPINNENRSPNNYISNPHNSNIISKNKINSKNSYLHSVLAIDDINVLLNHKYLFDIAYNCATVIIGRCEPLQKGNILRKFKEFYKDSVVLAIGDGVNDVDMIRCSDVGVGVEGREGSAAVLSSDFSIPTFSKLVRLLIIHGRYNCIRTSLLILVTFYKNLLLGLPQFFYGFYNGFSATSAFDSGYYAMYNVILTIPQHFMACVYEEDINDKLCIKYPEVYCDYQNNGGFSAFNIFWYYFISIIHSSLIYFVAYFGFNNNLLNSESLTFDHSLLTQIIGWTLMSVFTYEMFYVFHAISIPQVLMNISCLVSNFAIQYFYSFAEQEYDSILERSANATCMWLEIPFVVGVCMIIDMTMSFLRPHIQKLVTDQVIKHEWMKNHKKYRSF